MTEFLDPTRAAYRVLDPHGFFGPDDTLHPESAEIYYDGEPNESLEPLTPVAEQRMQDFIQKLDTAAREVSLKLGRPYSGRPRSADGGFTLARMVQQASVPVMGHLEGRDNSSISPVNKIDTPETSKRGRGRPRNAEKLLAIS